jgi:hypothetical protein
MSLCMTDILSVASMSYSAPVPALVLLGHVGCFTERPQPARLCGSKRAGPSGDGQDVRRTNGRFDSGHGPQNSVGATTKDTKSTKMEFDQLSNRMIGCAIEVHRNLRPGLLESGWEQSVDH